MENIGIEPKQLLMQLINFTLMIVILTKLLYKPIIKMLEDRRQKIEQGLKDAQKSKEDLDKADLRKQEILSKAREEAREIIDQAKKNAKKVEADIIKKAQDEASLIIEKGKKDLEGERDQMKLDLKRETIEIASAMAEKVIGQVLTSTDQKKLLEKRVQDLHRIVE